MKKQIFHAVVLDNLYCILSLLYRMVKNSTIVPCANQFIFVHYAGGLYDSKLQVLKAVKTLSTARGNERVSFSLFNLRDPKLQKAITQGKVDFARVNVILFTDLRDVFKCFSIDEVELFFIGANKDMLVELINHKCITTPSIAMTSRVSTLFYEYGVPFTYAEYFREILFLKGKTNAKIHVKRSIISSELDTPTYNWDNINGILTEYFSDPEGESEDDESEDDIDPQTDDASDEE